MNPKTGDILAMVTYPNYNLNSPYEVTNEEIKRTWETLTATQRNTNLQAMWRNKAIADTYLLLCKKALLQLIKKGNFVVQEGLKLQELELSVGDITDHMGQSR